MKSILSAALLGLGKITLSSNLKYRERLHKLQRLVLHPTFAMVLIFPPALLHLAMETFSSRSQPPALTDGLLLARALE
jgi:hypothetical protein